MQVGSPITTTTLVSQVILGLEEEYNPVVVGIQGKLGISWLDMAGYAMKLLSYEKRLDHQNVVKTQSTLAQTPSINAVFNHNKHSSLGNSCFSDGKNRLMLKNIKCVPDIAKNLISVSKLAQDNVVCIEFYSDLLSYTEQSYEMHTAERGTQ